MSQVRICIVDDASEIREALEEIIGIDPNYTCVAKIPNGELALEMIPDIKPDVVLMDINLGGITGIECVKMIKEYYPDILFMMCTNYEEDEKIFDALAAGANGYILKKTAPDKMLSAIQELIEGGAPMSSLIARKVVAAFRKEDAVSPMAKPIEEELPELSTREMQILELLSKGLMYKEIGKSLGISPETVRKHVYNIYGKLHVSNRVQALTKVYGNYKEDK